MYFKERYAQSIARRNGFTLLEALVALSVFAIMSSAGFYGLNAAITSRGLLQEESSRLRDMALFFSIMENDLSMAVSRPARAGREQILRALVGGSSVEFTRVGNAQSSEQQSSLRRVGYRLKNGSIELLIWPVVDKANLDMKPDTYKVLSDVNSFTMRYYNGQKWFNTWEEGSLPKAVEVNITTAQDKTFTRIFSMAQIL